MKKKIITLIVLLSISISIYSQHDFRQGFIIDNNNDTIPGFIDYQGDIKLSQHCLFKKHEKDEFVIYQPSEILGYRFINDKYFVSKEVLVGNLKEKRFLEFLLHGAVDLFSLKDLNGVRFFIQKGFDFIELKQTEVVDYVDSHVYKKIKKEYIGPLKYFLSDVPSISNKVDNLSLNRKSLINIAEEYHNQVCTDNKCVIYKKNLPKTKINIGLIGGYNLSSIKDEPSFHLVSKDFKSSYFYNGDFRTSRNPILGIYVNIPFNFTNDKFSFQYEGNINYKDFQSTFVKTSTLSPTVLNGKYSFSYYSLYNNFLSRFDLLKWKLRPIFFLGLSVNRNFNCNYNNVNIPDTQVGVNMSFPNVTYYSLVGGIGLAYKFYGRDFTFRIMVNRGYGVMKFLDTEDIGISLGVPILYF